MVQMLTICYVHMAIVFNDEKENKRKHFNFL